MKIFRLVVLAVGSAASVLIAAVQPGPPIISSASPGHKQFDIIFSAPADTGGAPIANYTVTATPVSGVPVTVTSASSGRITVTGLTNGTTYSVTMVATNSANLTSVPTAPIEVVLPATPLPTNIQQPVSQTVTQGYPVSFNASAFSPAPLTIRWFKDGQPITGATSFTYTIDATAAKDAGAYFATLTNEAGTVTSSTAILTVNTPYTFSTLAGVPGHQGFADGQGNLARFNRVSGDTVDSSDRTGVATDADGNIFVADTGNHIIRKITPAGLVTTLAGSPGIAGSIDGRGSAARLNQPSGVAVDSTGNLFIADTGNHVVRKISTGGDVTTLAGAAGMTGSADGNSAVARFNAPRGVAVDAAGNVYVADSGNFTVRKIGPGGEVTTLAGLAGNNGRTDGTGAVARFNAPIGLAVDTAGNVFVADFGAGAIRKITPLGVVTTVTNSLLGIVSPTAIVSDSSGNIYITSASGFLSLLANNGTLTTIAGRGNFPGAVNGTGSAVRFSRPSGVAADGAGNLFVADASAIRKGVLGIPPLFAVQPTSATGRRGGLAAFSISASGPPAPTLQWQVSTDHGSSWANLTEGEPLAGTTSGTLSISPLSAAFTGFQYRCVASNIAGTIPSIAATLTVLAVPANDSFANATVLPGLTATATGENFNALKQDGEPNHAGNVGGHSVWWKWVPPGNGTASVDTFGSDFNTLLAVYTGNSVNALTPVAANDDSGGGVASAVSFSAVSGTLYWIAADGFDGATGNINLHLSQAPDFALTVSMQPADQTTTIGYNASFTIQTSGTPAPTLQWQESRDGRAHWVSLGDSAVYSGVTTNTLSLTASTAEMAGYQYRCVATNSSGTVASGAATLQLERGYTFTSLAGSSSAGSADGVGPAAKFHFPRSVATDSAGNTYVADTSNNSIRKITPSGVVTTLAGPEALIGSPTGVAVDPMGNVYASDTGGNSIRKISPDGTVTVLAGLPGAFNPRLADGVGSNAHFNSPRGLAVASDGTVYVADTFNSSIRRITSAGVVTTFAGSNAAFPASGSSDGVGVTARFNRPRALALDNSGNLYVADTNNRTIRKITPDGTVTTIAGSVLVTGSADGVGSAAQFGLPIGLAVDSDGNVFVADAGNNSIRKITPAGVVTTLTGAAGVRGSTDGALSAARFNFPNGLAIDTSGNLIVADTLNYTVRKISPAGIVSTLAGTAGGPGNADGVGASSSFNGPTGIVVDTHGVVLVTDRISHTIRKITAGGVVTTLAGAAGLAGAVDGTGSEARLSSPWAITVDSAGNAFILDDTNNLRRKITSSGVVSSVGLDWFSNAPFGVSVSNLSLSQPTGMAVDPSGNIYVADFGNAVIRKITGAGVGSTFAGGFGLASGTTDGPATDARFVAPSGLARDDAGNLYVSDATGTVRKISPDGIVSTLAGSPVGSGSTDGVGGSALFNVPFGIAVDSAGNLFVADNGNSIIRKISNLGLVTTIAGSPLNKGATDGAGTDARFFQPLGVAVDLAGNVYVADTSNNTIRWGAIAPPALTSTTTASGAVGHSFSYTTAFDRSLTGFNASGLPTGLSIDSATGLISGAPAAAGHFSVTLSSVNGAGVGSGTLALDVSAADQTITFSGPPNQPFTTNPIALVATASSGLPVSFTVISGPATISGSNLILTGAGTVTVRASQAGDGGFNAALPVEQTFTVTANFLLWQQSRFTPGELADPTKSGPNAVFGFDGLTNLVKYALGLEPKQDAVLGLPVLSNNGTDWVYTFTRPTATTDVNFAVEVSTNLVNWTTTGVTLEQISSANGVETWRGRVSISGKPRLYSRLRVTQILPL